MSSDVSRTSPTVCRPAATNALRILDGNSTSLIGVSSVGGPFSDRGLASLYLCCDLGGACTRQGQDSHALVFIWRPNTAGRFHFPFAFSPSPTGRTPSVDGRPSVSRS